MRLAESAIKRQESTDALVAEGRLFRPTGYHEQTAATNAAAAVMQYKQRWRELDDHQDAHWIK
jgi:hypothetical protein